MTTLSTSWTPGIRCWMVSSISMTSASERNHMIMVKLVRPVVDAEKRMFLMARNSVAAASCSPAGTFANHWTVMGEAGELLGDFAAERQHPAAQDPAQLPLDRGGVSAQGAGNFGGCGTAVAGEERDDRQMTLR